MNIAWPGTELRWVGHSKVKEDRSVARGFVGRSWVWIDGEFIQLNSFSNHLMGQCGIIFAFCSNALPDAMTTSNDFFGCDLSASHDVCIFSHHPVASSVCTSLTPSTPCRFNDTKRSYLATPQMTSLCSLPPNVLSNCLVALSLHCQVDLSSELRNLRWHNCWRFRNLAIKQYKSMYRIIRIRYFENVTKYTICHKNMICGL